MKLRRTKGAFLIIALVLLCGSIALKFNEDHLTYTRGEMDILYQKEFINFKIDKIINVPYPTGRGNYRLFSSIRQTGHFPILLEKGDHASYELFEVGAVINKPAFSLIATLQKGEEINNVTFRNPADVTTKGDIVFEAVVFGFILVLFIILPNAFFENLVKIFFNYEEKS